MCLTEGRSLFVKSKNRKKQNDQLITTWTHGMSLRFIRLVHVTVTTVQVNRFETEKAIRIIRRQIKSCTNTTPSRTSIIPHFSSLEELC